MVIKMKKRIIVFIIAAFMFITVFAACNQNEKRNSEKTSETVHEGSTATSTDESKPKPSLDLLPNRDYDGYDFIITYRDLYNSLDDMSFTSECDNILDEEKYLRARKIEDSYNINLVPTALPGDLVGWATLDSVIAGENEYDIIMPHSHYAWSLYIIPGYALEWTKNMTYNQIDQEWWDQGAYECLSVGGKYYTMLGDSSWKLLGSSVGILFNKIIFDEMGEVYPYDDVDKMSWTFDRFNEVAKKTVKDVNGDNAIKLGDDRYGFTTGIWMGPMGFLWTTGKGIVTKNSEDIPELTLYNDTTVSLYDKFVTMMSQDGFYIYPDRDSFDTQFHKEFIQGEVAMIDTMIENIAELRNMYDWGIVPYPMFDESVGRYYSTVDAGLHTPIVPYLTEDPERTSIILEALTIEGHNRVIPAFYEKTLQIKYTDDEKSWDMLDLINSSRNFDLGYMTGHCAGVFGLIGTRLIQNNTNLTVYYNQHFSEVQEELNDFITALTD